ncbi:ABC transporter substrate-binding protein [bacterium RCC_150]
MSNRISEPQRVDGASRRGFLKLGAAAGAAAGFAAVLSGCDITAPTSVGASSPATANPNLSIEAGLAYALSTGFDPLSTVSATPLAANLHIFEALVELHPVTREAYNALAASDPLRLDDTTYRVILREGARFHNGSAVTAEDVAYSFARVLDPHNKSLLARFIPFIKSVDVLDSKTIDFSLKYPFPGFGPRLSVIKIVPKDIVSAGQKAFNAKPIGSGPYKLASAPAAMPATPSTPAANPTAKPTKPQPTASEIKILFEAFADYNGPKPPLAKGMTWWLLPEPAARVTALQSGQVQAIENVPHLDVDGLKSKSRVEFVQSFEFMFLMFNCAKPPFDNKLVRQALHYGLDKDGIIKKALSGNATPATSYFPEGHPAYAKARNVYAYDPQKSAGLLNQAGLGSLEFELLTTDTAWVKDVSAGMLDSWNKIPGVKATIKNVGSSVLESGVGDYSVIAAPADPSVLGNDAGLVLGWFYSGTSWLTDRVHWNGPESPALQALMDNLSRAPAAETKSIAGQIVDLVSDAVPLYPLFHRKIATAWDDKKLLGFKPLPTTGLSFLGVGRAT